MDRRLCRLLFIEFLILKHVEVMVVSICASFNFQKHCFMQIFMYMAFSNYDDTAYEGAIMFGDSLLPSECSIIVEELKKTSLCFQV